MAGYRLRRRGGRDGANRPGSGRGDDDADAGAKIHQRAARMANSTLRGWQSSAPDLVVSDVITTAGGLARSLLGLRGSS